MRPGFEPDVAVGILGSGRALANVANAAAVISGIGFYYAGRGVSAALLLLSLACWACESYFAMRVRIDEGLFRVFASQPEDGGASVDHLLLDWKLIRRAKPRSIQERCRGALRLWRFQLAVLIAQLILLGAALVLRVAKFA